MKKDHPAPPQRTSDTEPAGDGFGNRQGTTNPSLPRIVLPVLIGSVAAVIGGIVLTCVLYTKLTIHLKSLEKEAENKIEVLENRLVALEKLSTEIARIDSELKAKTGEMQTEFESDGTNRRQHVGKAAIDVTVPVMQEIGFGFLTSHLSVEQLPGGAGIRGRIVNSTSLDHKNAKFRLTAANTTRDFTVSSLPAGSSSRFDIYVPDLSAREVSKISLEYLESAVSYSRGGS